MKQFFLIILCLPILINVAYAADRPEFFAGLPDIPLAEGLYPLEDQSTVFDKPSGRIVHIIAEIKTDNSPAIENYYEETLPALGWYRRPDLSYQRDQEHLNFWFETNEGETFFNLQIEPID